MRYLRLLTIIFMMIMGIESPAFCQESNPNNPKELFLKVIAPALETKCIKCHNTSKARGGLSLISEDSLVKGSENGPILEKGKPEESRLLEVLTGPEPEMPENDKPLEPAVIEAIKVWIKSGASWPGGVTLTDQSPKTEKPLWSLQPITDPSLPELTDDQKIWVHNPIDYFIAASHRKNQVQPAPEADRHMLIRRLYYDLTGLPPDPKSVHEFVNDRRPNAYEKLVDRLLASPAYGERWARHWLDIVHYGETHGYDKDKPRPNSWPYRDYVIKALNDDKPYGQFVREQIAGDALYPSNPEAIKALGFLAAGPWDFIGHAEVPESKTDGKIARHIDRDDMVGTAVGSILSLTIQCAQCHDHKFDPLLQKDYYQLQAVFSAVDRTDRPYFDSPADQLAHETTNRSRLALIRKIAELNQEIRLKAGPELEQWQRRIEFAKAALQTKDRPEFGYHSQIEKNQDAKKWVQLDFDKPVQIHKIVLAPASDSFNNIGPGFGFPVRFRIDSSEDHTFASSSITRVDRTKADYANPGISPQVFEINDRTAVRSIRLTATKLAPRQNDYIFALAEITVIDEQGHDITRNAKVKAFDSIEAPPRWQLRNLTDGIAPGQTDTGTSAKQSLAQLEKERDQWLRLHVNEQLLDTLNQCESELEKANASLSKLPKAKLVYAAGVHQGTGAFAGTGVSGGVPRPIHLLPRGDVKNPQSLVEPAPVSSLKWDDSAFKLANPNDEALRRAALARWITHRDNPLIWRSIVNRVWQYHFGQGIVDPPGDFGNMGGKPSHPELLDYLAGQLRDQGESLKSLHRLILTSATYRQNSTGNLEYARKDAGNKLLWRQNRRKLEAEAIRDSLLSVAGILDQRMGGPSFQDFVIEHPEHSPHYEYQLSNPDDPATFRRSIYRFIVRSQPQPFLTAMDCADPSIRVDKRNESISASAALAQWNHAQVLNASRHFGQLMENRPGNLSGKLAWCFEKTFSRTALPDELAKLTEYAAKHGLESTARILFNLNEFTFVD